MRVIIVMIQGKHCIIQKIIVKSPYINAEFLERMDLTKIHFLQIHKKIKSLHLCDTAQELENSPISDITGNRINRLILP